jgi:hypothetical protein
MKTFITNAILVLIVSQILAVGQEDLRIQQKSVEIKQLEELPDDLKELYLKFFSALKERDIQICPMLFGGFEIHKSVFSGIRSEAALEKSFEIARSDYLNDCKRIMDQLPKTGRLLQIVSFDYSSSRVVRVGNATIITGVVVECSYGTRLARLTLSPPPAAHVSGKWYFLDRAEQGVRFLSLDPETGE